MKKIPLIMSLIVNILLVVAVCGIRLHYHRAIFQTLYNITISDVRFQEGVLAELQSEDEYKIMAVKTMLKQNIQKGKESAEIWKAASERVRLK
ncbi:MAG: hypothetical protein NTW93_02655 [Phycisphaerae bacterium]|nr:hypothetical protein [Phycisphaerae bacterium]